MSENTEVTGTEVIETTDTATTPAPTSADRALRPRTRWAGIVWGLVLATLAAAAIWLVSEPGRLDDLVAWVRDLSPATAVGYGILAVGALLLVTGLVGLLRRAQRAGANRSRS